MIAAPAYTVLSTHIDVMYHLNSYLSVKICRKGLDYLLMVKLMKTSSIGRDRVNLHRQDSYFPIRDTASLLPTE